MLDSVKHHLSIRLKIRSAIRSMALHTKRQGRFERRNWFPIVQVFRGVTMADFALDVGQVRRLQLQGEASRLLK